MSSRLRLAGLALVAVPLLLLWAYPDAGFFPGVFSTPRPAGGTPSPLACPPPPLAAPLRRALPNPERCTVIEAVPGWVEITYAVPPARARVRWWCDDDRVYES